MDGESRPSRTRAVGRAVLRVLLPFDAMRQTIVLARQEAQRTKDNLAALRELARDARRSVGSLPEAVRGDESFDQALARRRPDAMTIPELRRHFLSKKRAALGAALGFGVAALVQVGLGLWHLSGRDMLFGTLCLAGGQPLFFVVALGAQLRLWQLDNRRLSRAERASLADFRREVPRWWLATLNPELKRRSEVQQ